MKGMSALFSHKKDEWSTPQDLFDQLHREFSFKLDAAATAGNAKCEEYFTSEDNALSRSWCEHGSIWLNPPFSRIGDFIRKAYSENLKGCTVVSLLPARTDTAYWHGFVMKASEIRFIRGRLKFGGSAGSAPFPSAIVVFRQDAVGQGPPRISGMERPLPPSRRTCRHWSTVPRTTIQGMLSGDREPTPSSIS